MQRDSRACHAIFRRRPTCEPSAVLAGFEHAQPASRAACLQALIGLFLLFGGNHGLTCVAAFADAGTRDELCPAAAALLRHCLLKREDPRLFGEQVRIMKVAMVHVRHLKKVIGNQVSTWNPGLGHITQGSWPVAGISTTPYASCSQPTAPASVVSLIISTTSSGPLAAQTEAKSRYSGPKLFVPTILCTPRAEFIRAWQ